MGAGVQRWWREPPGYEQICERWCANEVERLANLILRSPRREMLRVRVIVAAYNELWKEIAHGH